MTSLDTPLPAGAPVIYRFGRFQLNAATREVLVDQEPAPLGTRAFDVLLALIERRERLVTKSELLDLAWPGLIVEENNLQVQVSALRKLLGPQVILTVPGRGYRFIAAVDRPAITQGSVPVQVPHETPGPPPTTGGLSDLGAELPLPSGRREDLQDNTHAVESTLAQLPSRSGTRWQHLTRALGRRWIAGGVLAIGVAGIALWTLPQFWKAMPSSPTPPAYSIVVLPFATPGGNPADEQFADSLTDDLTMALGHIHSAHVVSHGVAATYKGNAIDARTIGRDHNVRYVVQGEVRHIGERITVNAQLIDTTDGAQLWSDRIGADPTQVASDPDGFVARLIRRVGDAINGVERRRAGAPLGPGASAMDLTRHAVATYFKISCVANVDCVKATLEVRQLLDEALRLDPSLVSAMIWRAATLVDQLEGDLYADHDRLVKELDEVSSRAVATDPDAPGAWIFRAYALCWQWRWQAALEANSKAITLEPFGLWPLIQRARLMQYTGRPAEALEWIEKAFALEPQWNAQAGNALLRRCQAYQALGRYDEAIVSCEKSIAQWGDWWANHVYLVAAYAQKGENAKAEAEKRMLMKEVPGMTIADIKALRVSNDPTYLQQTEMHLYAGLRKAGILEK
jgi:TolB-like protein/DNA-binding winged helix-turn-helix (wHTH) protein